MTPPADIEPDQRFRVRRARTADVRHIRGLLDGYAAQRILLSKETVTLYEDIQEFWVAETVSDAAPGTVVGCGALHVMWEDLAEVRTLAVAPEWRRHGVGHALLSRLLRVAEELGVVRVFCLTFEVDFFARHGFERVEGTPVDTDVYAQLLRSADEGVAEFLDLDRVKPNTLGNVRMLRRMGSASQIGGDDSRHMN
ncbi:amino-acid N-acetyltransferase [Jiangella rhizosphaerae]|uniref:Amino-acid N-acetyltransferase n=1 Tax=Jiangella rhizosphaerae TaxID=2293569 RepID=A0A418KUS0_9ACTN|nr:amino-acid N-acetyltransferase [Jiangella rhizosphaerae]RIQ30976.1 amino-acid N-acetyltransferase [Jiangella rhizosphaerae]